MSDRRSPIERMIDEATGFDPADVPPQIMLGCPKCGKSQGAALHESDPEGTALVKIICPDCNPGDRDMPRYFDRYGTELVIS